ncbi:MAG: glutamate dehydrogenase [Candidatus Woesearchaeota archaeon]|nr:glutamate dehydrogenase [Candidatus Woesearchaeota archaeon]
MKMETFLESNLKLVKEAAKLLGLSDISYILKPKRIIEVNFPARMDDGKIKYFTGYRVNYNDSRGPAKGGVRFHPSVSFDEVSALALGMAFKTSLLRLPFGGGKGGVVVDPKAHSALELERISRGYARALSFEFDPDLDVPAPDVYTSSREMSWILDELETIKSRHMPAVITGKPIELSGSLGRNYSTAMGGFYILQEYIKSKGKKPEETTIAVQGAGNVGGLLAKIAYDHGYKVVAISDSSGAVYDSKGLNIEDVLNKKQSTGHLEGGKKITNEELLQLEVDVLAPAALENQITKENAYDIKARLVLEMANGPVTEEASSILYERGIDSLPDILCNAGGVVVSHFEWVQNRTGEIWSEEQISEKLKKSMTDAFKDVEQMKQDKGTSYKNAAYTIALKRIHEAEKLRGNAN